MSVGDSAFWKWRRMFADITYSHTSMSSAGDEFVATFTADYYQRFMQAWEKELNYFLTTGSRLTDGTAA